MPSLRRAIAFLVLLGAIYVAFHLRGNSNYGMIGPVFLLIAIFVAFFALAVAVFNLPVTRVTYKERESGFENTVLSESQGTAFGAAVVFLFGVLLVFVAVRGVYQNRMPVPWSAPDISFAQAPLVYVAATLFWLGTGGGVIAFSVKLFGIRNAQPQKGRGRGHT